MCPTGRHLNNRANILYFLSVVSKIGEASIFECRDKFMKNKDGSTINKKSKKYNQKLIDFHHKFLDIGPLPLGILLDYFD